MNFFKKHPHYNGLFLPYAQCQNRILAISIFRAMYSSVFLVHNSHFKAEITIHTGTCKSALQIWHQSVVYSDFDRTFSCPFCDWDKTPSSAYIIGIPVQNETFIRKWLTYEHTLLCFQCLKYLLAATYVISISFGALFCYHCFMLLDSANRQSA